MNQVIRFLKNIEKKDNVIVIYHNDGDGLCSALLLKKVLPTQPLFISQPMPIERNLIDKVRTTIPNRIIILDLAVDQQPDIVKRLNKICDLLIVDHHQVHLNISKRKGNKIIYYNPRLRKPEIYQSCSYIVYKICSCIKDMGKYLWIAAIGMISDYDLEDSKDLVKEVKKKYEIEDLKRSLLGNISDAIIAIKATRDLSMEEIIYLFDNAENPEDVYKTENGKKLLHSYQLIESEIIGAMTIAESKKEQYKNLFLYNLESKYNLRSPLSTRLSELYPRKFIAVYQILGNKIRLSARNQDRRFNVGKILERACKGLKNSVAGGHAVSAGATIDVKEWDDFKQALIEILEK